MKPQLTNPPETEFAACLLSCGGPDRLRPAGTTYQRDKGVLFTGDDSRSHYTCMEPITSADYMFRCCDWYDENLGGAFGSTGISTPPFAHWWTKYKEWLWENRRG